MQQVKKMEEWGEDNNDLYSSVKSSSAGGNNWGNQKQNKLN